MPVDTNLLKLEARTCTARMQTSAQRKVFLFVHFIPWTPTHKLVGVVGFRIVYGCFITLFFVCRRTSRLNILISHP